VVIREATLDDLPRLLELAERFHASTIYASLVPWAPAAVEALMVAVIAQQNSIIGVVFVAELDGRIEGMLGLVALPHPMSGQLCAEELAWWVEPEHRKGTIGPRLLVTGIDWCRQKMARVLKLVAPAGSTVGTFYRRWGAVEVETAYLMDLPP
jgi:GNAT superfamily N-acetyltransferase